MIDYSNVRAGSLRTLRRLDIPAHPHLPLLDESVVRPPDQVARRLIVLACQGALREGVPGRRILAALGADMGDELTAEERTLFLADGPLPDSHAAEYSWNASALEAGLWSLALLDDLTLPPGLPDVDTVGALVPPAVDAASFIGTAALRPASEIIVQADLHYCLDASLRHDDLWGGQPVTERYPVVQRVMARRQLFDWLLWADSWDEISLDV